jgi:hypothetical protein
MPTNIMVETEVAAMGEVGVEDLEKLQTLRLGGEDQTELLATATECTFVFTGKAGWPRGVIMSFVHADGRFWLTAVGNRPHARALLDDPRVTIVVTNAGTGLSGRRMLAFRGIALVHRDEDTKRYFFPRFTRKLAPASAEEFERLLDSPERVVIEVRPVSVAVSHDSRKLPGDGRGGERPASWNA